MRKIILIDNYDSFTFNLYHYLSSLRVNFEGGDRRFSDLFFKSFFAALDKSLFLDQTID